MIKLITQFDNNKSKPSLATPTCGCCCCCCCCVVSTFATASISARSFGRYAEKEMPDEPKKIKRVRSFGFWMPIGLLVSACLGVWIAMLLGVEGDTSSMQMVAAVVGILYLFIVTFLIEEKLNLSGMTPRAVTFAVVLVAFETVGFYVGMYALTLFGWYYVVGAIIISALLVYWAFAKKYNGSKEIKSQENTVKSKENTIDEKSVATALEHEEKNDS